MLSMHVARTGVPYSIAGAEPHLRLELLDERPLVLQQREALRHVLGLPRRQHSVNLRGPHIPPCLRNKGRQMFGRLRLPTKC